MGLSTAGLAFSRSASTPDEAEIVHLAFGNRFIAMNDDEVSKHHDIRRPENLAFETIGNATFIYSGELARKFLFSDEPLAQSFFDALGNPVTAMVFCHYDSGDSFGYRIFEHGVCVRRRLYTGSHTIDEGVPKAFEQSWLSAEQFLEDDDLPAYRNNETGQVSTEGYVTAAMLRLALTEYFGTCPWDDWSYKTKLNRYHMAPQPDAPLLARTPWWRKLW